MQKNEEGDLGLENNITSGTKTIRYIGDSAVTPPHRGSDGAAAWDMHAAEDATLKPYEYARIRTGLRAEIPKGYVLLILPRSGFSFKNQVIAPNSVGVIDEDYRGEMWITACWQPPIAEAYKVRLASLLLAGSVKTTAELVLNKDIAFEVKKGDRIAQALLVKYEEQDWRAVDELSVTKRDAGGFGSTGLRADNPWR